MVAAADKCVTWIRFEEGTAAPLLPRVIGCEFFSNCHWVQKKKKCTPKGQMVIFEHFKYFLLALLLVFKRALCVHTTERIYTSKIQY